MAPPNPKTPSLLLEAIKFAAGIDRETPYDDLTKAALDAGWVWYLRQADVAQIGANVLVNFDVLLGKTEGADLSPVDTISVMVNAGQGPLSSAARNLATASLIHLFFGRLPPAPTPPTPARDPRALYEHVDHEDAFDRQAPNDDTESAFSVIERRTPDGLPIFVDLYSIGHPGPAVANAVLNEIEAVLPEITSVPALNALFTSNPDLLDYMKDLASPDQRVAFKRMLDRRKEALEDGGSVAPRRRSAQVVN